MKPEALKFGATECAPTYFSLQEIVSFMFHKRMIEVRGMPNGIFHPWVRWDSGVEVARKFFRRRRRRRRRRPPKVGVW